MRRADRLFLLIHALRGRRHAITAQQLAQTLEVSLRTIYRDVADRSKIRAMTGFVASRHCRIPLTRTARFFHRDGTTLVRDVRRLEANLERTPELCAEL